MHLVARRYTWYVSRENVDMVSYGAGRGLPYGGTCPLRPKLAFLVGKCVLAGCLLVVVVAGISLSSTALLRVLHLPPVSHPEGPTAPTRQFHAVTRARSSLSDPHSARWPPRRTPPHRNLAHMTPRSTLAGLDAARQCRCTTLTSSTEAAGGRRGRSRGVAWFLRKGS